MRKNTVLVYDDHEKLSEACAHFFVLDANRCISKRGRFSIALSGSQTPQRFHQLLASQAFSKNIPWHKVFIFWGDERHVPPTDEQSNFRMAYENLLQYIKIPEENIFPVPTLNKSPKDALNYEKSIYKVFNKNLPRFDWMVMGLGTNGHTASLFPFSEVLKEKDRLVMSSTNTDNGQERITFTYPLINAARQLFFLVSGKEKAAMVKEAIEGSQPKKIIPVHGVKPEDGNLTWMLDKDAASLLHSYRTFQKEKV
jgi:6-phosphogluconolactonase